jgi:hypothetical protein
LGLPSQLQGTVCDAEAAGCTLKVAVLPVDREAHGRVLCHAADLFQARSCGDRALDGLNERRPVPDDFVVAIREFLGPEVSHGNRSGTHESTRHAEGELAKFADVPREWAQEKVFSHAAIELRGRRAPEKGEKEVLHEWDNVFGPLA